jgi:hypothetical protein
MTLDPDHRVAIRALVLENASTPPPASSSRFRFAAVASSAVVVAVVVATATVAGLGLSETPEVARPALFTSEPSGSQDYGLEAGASSDAVPPDSALGLVGLWELEGAEGEESDWLRFDGMTLTALRNCGEIFWDVTATAGLLVTSRAGGDQSCFQESDSSPVIDDAWGQSLAAYRPAGDGWILLDDAGNTVGRLTVPGDIPTALIERGLDLAPVETEQTSAALRDPTPLGPEWTAATPGQLLGTWSVVDDPNEVPASVTFRRGDYYVTDCHTVQEGRDPSTGIGDDWNGDGTLFVAPPVTSDAMACGPALPIVASSIRAIAYHSGQLVLFDAVGAELARLEKS